MISGLQTDYDHANALVSGLIDHSTYGAIEDADYNYLRNYFISDNRFKGLLPQWFASKRSPDQFWQFIKHKLSTYAERREFLWSEFEPLLSFCEGGNGLCAEPDITAALSNLDSESVNRYWAKAMERLDRDPEGAITAGRTLVESVCKHILEQRGVQYKKSIKLNQLYRKAAEELNLAPEQHNEELFRQVLGGCMSVVNGLGSLRNTYGDAHAPSELSARPHSRHARLVVNLAGAMSLFLVETANK
ncbi:abortive infection family protein [uncultured Pseudodesulfovibrio sp.]|uniref:abortive infection family protein n=1 Tax=uncultured Pseudodesulfovibrio sp. TaxID=2035858 RepID=UPI0029C8935A|nr:abortive infection family protein [uncultured Pseudodesulfovibrio sp.]